MDNKSFADKMREMQMSSSTVLPSHSYLILQLDGRAFHTWTRGLKRPFDDEFIDGMDKVATVLAKEISGIKFGYVQSDEINFLITDWDTPDTQSYYGNRVQKIVSTSAGLASAVLSGLFPNKGYAVFDSRLFVAPTKESVVDWFHWRQTDAIKNSVRAVANNRFSHKALTGVSTPEAKVMLTEIGDSWENYSDGEKNGRLVFKEPYTETKTFFHKKEKQEKKILIEGTRWVTSGVKPFKETSVLEDLIPEHFIPSD